MFRLIGTFTNNIIQIQQKEIDKAHKTLGCFKCIDRNEAAEMIYLKTKSDAMVNMFENYGLTNKQAKLAYNLVYISSLKYGLPSTIDNIIIQPDN
jgi:hypothetical protein